MADTNKTVVPGLDVLAAGAVCAPGGFTTFDAAAATGKVYATTVVANTKLCVGNSAAANTLGTVTGKIEVFNAAGVSLGFLPVYDAITTV